MKSVTIMGVFEICFWYDFDSIAAKVESVATASLLKKHNWDRKKIRSTINMSTEEKKKITDRATISQLPTLHIFITKVCLALL